MDVKISLPLLPLRDIVVFPSMVIPLFVGRDKSISALNEVMKKDKKIILVTQKNSEIDDPKKTDIFIYGCEGSVLQLLKLPDGTVKVLVEGIRRVKILDFKDNDKFITCDYTHYNDVTVKDEDLFPLAATALRRLEKLTSVNKKVSSETINTIKQLKDSSQIADNIASHLSATISEKQQIFETVDVKKRLNSIIKIMENETSIIGVEKRIRGRVKTQMEKTQREYYLNEQLKAIQKELGEIEDGKDETSSLNKSILKSKMPKDVEKKCMAELKKLKNMSPMSAEATVVRNYLDWMIDLPWYKKSEVDIDLTKALNTLDADHFGLEKVKERIIEFLAVQKRMNKIIKKIPIRFIKTISMIPSLAISIGLLYLLNNFLNTQFANKTLAEITKSSLDTLINTTSTAGSVVLSLIAFVIIFVAFIAIIMFFGSKIVNRIENILNIENEFERKWKALIFVLISIGLLYLAANIEKHYFPFGDITFFSTLFIIFGSISAFIYIFTFIGIIFDKIKKILDYLTDKYR